MKKSITILATLFLSASFTSVHAISDDPHVVAFEATPYSKPAKPPKIKKKLINEVYADGFITETSPAGCDNEGYTIGSFNNGNELSAKVSGEFIILEFDISQSPDGSNVELQFYVTHAVKAPTYVSGSYVIYGNTGDGTISPSDCSNSGGVQVYEDNQTTQGVALGINTISQNPNPAALPINSVTGFIRDAKAQGKKYVRFNIWNFDMRIYSKQGAAVYNQISPRLVYTYPE
jgi:hypothetical protein